MTLMQVAPISSTVPFLLSEERELDIVEKNTKVTQIVQETLQGIIALDTQGLVQQYLFVDLTMIYKQAGIVFDYIPKSLVPRRSPEDLTAAKREGRVLIGSKNDDILSRLLREFTYAQTEMAEEPKKAFAYMKLDGDESIATSLTEMEGYSVGASTCVGARGRDTLMGTWMEHLNQDRYAVEELQLTIGGIAYTVPFAGVFDGHGGTQVSEFAREHLKTVLLETLAEHNPEALSLRGIWNALKLVCVNLNTLWVASPGCDEGPGTTVLFFIELMDMVFVVNVGDSRGALNNKGMFIQLTDDNKPTKDRFKKGIEDRGGRVLYNGVDGELATARAVGDLSLGEHVSKRSKITMLPSSFLEVGSDVILTCDGVYDVSSTSQILKADEAHPERSPDQLAKDLLFSSFQAASGDNLTVLVIRKKERKVREG